MPSAIAVKRTCQLEGKSLDNGTAELLKGKTMEEKNRWKKDKSKKGYEGENEKGNQKHYWKSASKSGDTSKRNKGCILCSYNRAKDCLKKKLNALLVEEFFIAQHWKLLH